MGFFDFVKSVGQKIGEGAVNIGKKVGHAVGQGIKYANKGIKAVEDIPVLGTAVGFIPFEGAVSGALDIADHTRKIIEGKEEFGDVWKDMLVDAVSGGLSAVGGSGELKALKSGYKTFKGARAFGQGLGTSLKQAGRVVGSGYGLDDIMRAGRGLKAVAEHGRAGLLTAETGLRAIGQQGASTLSKGAKIVRDVIN